MMDKLLTSLESTTALTNTSNQSTSNQSRCESHKFEQHQKLKISNKKLEIHHKTMPNLPPEEWKICYYPVKPELLLCDTCRQTFTYTSALRRHMQVQHKPRNLICHECDYQTPRRDNMRRHLRMVHRLVKVGEVLNNLHKVCISRPRPLQASKATKDKLKKSRSKLFLITVKLPAPINDAPRNPTSKTNDEILVTTLNTQKQFHTKPIRKLPKRNKKQDDIDTLLDTLSDTISSTLIDSLHSPDTPQDTIPSTLIDSPDSQDKSLDTSVLLDIPTQEEVQDWCILDSIETTDQFFFV